MEQSGEFSLAFMDGVGHVETTGKFLHLHQGGVCMCLDRAYTLVAIKAERLQSTVCISGDPLLSPGQKEISPMKALKEPIQLFAVIKHVDLDSCL